MDNVKEIVKPNGYLFLKSCPFCGSNEAVYVQYERVSELRWKVLCPVCCAQVDNGYAQTKYAAQIVWNRRA
jgi:hypothetical protein